MDIIYKTSKIKKILTNVYHLFEIPLFFLGVNGSFLVGAAASSLYFCSNVEAIPELHKKCVSCDKKLLDCTKKSRKPEWHLCHAGLFDGIIPVTKDGVTAGYILFGHIRTDHSAFSLPSKHQDLYLQFQERPYSSLKDLKSLASLLSNIDFDDCIQIDTDKNFEELIMTYVDENLCQNISITKLCEDFHISRCYFYKIWKKNVGENFSSYILQKRINKAKRILRETDFPIYKVAESVGIKSYGIFCKAFQKRIGLTPSQYRKRTN